MQSKVFYKKMYYYIYYYIIIITIILIYYNYLFFKTCTPSLVQSELYIIMSYPELGTWGIFEYFK